MNELIGKQVKIFLLTGATCEGIITSYTDDSLRLVAQDSQNYLWINNPKSNVLMIHVIVEKTIPHDMEKIRKQVADPIADDLKLDKFEPDPTLRAKKLAELRQIQLQEHKKKVQKHLTSWQSQSPKAQEQPNYYEHPNFTNTSGHSSTKKGNGSSLSDLGSMRRVPEKSSKIR